MDILKQILRRFELHLTENELINSGDKLLLGVSGGADSTALLYLFSRLRYKHKLSLLAVHVNHQLRAAASDADEKQVKELCSRLNVPFIVRKIDLPPGGDLENRARTARFEVFDNILKAYKFNKIVLGHHKWDLAETALMNLIRGAGLGGLAGIKARQNSIIHPLLIFQPDELRAVLIEQNFFWCEDATNQESFFTRNRLRNELIPAIERDFNPRFKDKLSETAAILSEADDYIKKRSLIKYKKLLLDATKERIWLSLPDLQKAKKIEQYYILRHAFHTLSGQEQDFMSAHHREIQNIMEAGGSKHISLPKGIFVKKQYQELIFSTVAEDLQAEAATEMIIDEERSRMVYMDFRFSFKYLKVLPNDYHLWGPNKSILDLDKVSGPIGVRSRLPGDRFIPLGMKNFKKLKDFFIDEKVAKYDRVLIPVFTDREKLLWICGHRLDERVRVDENSSRYLMITAEPLNQKPKRAANRIKRGFDEFDEL